MDRRKTNYCRGLSASRPMAPSALAPVKVGASDRGTVDGYASATFVSDLLVGVPDERYSRGA